MGDSEVLAPFGPTPPLRRGSSVVVALLSALVLACSINATAGPRAKTREVRSPAISATLSEEEARGFGFDASRWLPPATARLGHGFQILGSRMAPPSSRVTLGDSAVGVWSELEPPCRYGNGAVYDPPGHRMIVWGGYSDSEELWSCDLATGSWTRLHPQGEIPAGRGDVQAVYDPARRRMIFIDGTRFDANGETDYGEAWTLSLNEPVTWQRLAPAGPAPPWRFGAAFIYDPIRDRVIMDGGFFNNMGPTDEVWALTLDPIPTWSQIHPVGGSPLARYGHVAVYDSRRDRMVIHGGLSYPDSSAILWALPLGDSNPSWTRIAPIGLSPGHQEEHVAAYDSLTDRLILIGSSQVAQSDSLVTWDLDLSPGGTWEPILATGRVPPSRREPSLVVDPVSRAMFLYGGQDFVTTSCEVWRLPLDGPFQWARVSPTYDPPRVIWGAALAYDERRNRMILLGPLANHLDSLQVLALPLDGPVRWETLNPTGPQPASRSGATAIYDPVRDRVILYGGVHQNAQNETYVLDDLWSLSLGGAPTWTALNPLNGPSRAIVGHSAIYDPIRDRMVVFGGEVVPTNGQYTASNATMALSLGDWPRWSTIETIGPMPEPRSDQAMIYDPRRDRVVVYAGDARERLNDIWALPLGGTPAWKEILTTGDKPLTRDSFAAIYDPVGDRLVIHGGFVTGGATWTYGQDFWAFSLAEGTWAELHPAGTTILGRERHSALYDPRGDRMLVFGGNTFFDYSPSLWELAWHRTQALGLIRLISVETSPEGSRLSWQASNGAGVPATVERSDGGGNWALIGRCVADSVGTWVFDDLKTGGIGQRADRLAVDTPSGRVYSDPVSLEPYTVPAPILAGARPNPGVGSPTIWFTLWSADPAQLEVYSVTGRRLGRYEVGSLGGGYHGFNLQGRLNPSPGLYLVRLSQAGHAVTKKIVIL